MIVGSPECRNNVAPTYRPRAADVWSLGIVLINMLVSSHLSIYDLLILLLGCIIITPGRIHPTGLVRHLTYIAGILSISSCLGSLA